LEWLEIELPGLPDWRVYVRPQMTATGPEIAEFVIRPKAADVPPGGLTRNVLRAVHLRDLREAVRVAVAQVRRDTEIAIEDGVITEGDPASTWDPPEVFEQWGRRPGRAGRPDLYYAEMASQYVELLAGGTRAPVRELAERHHLSGAQLRGILHAARQRGLLTAAPAGKSGGRLTAKAKRILSAERS
jgi:hypothetical protein